MKHLNSEFPRGIIISVVCSGIRTIHISRIPFRYQLSGDGTGSSERTNGARNMKRKKKNEIPNAIIEHDLTRRVLGFLLASHSHRFLNVLFDS